MSLYSLSVRMNTTSQQIDLLYDTSAQTIDLLDFCDIMYNKRPVAEYETE